MARHVRNPKIESRAARAKLKPSGKPTYFDLGGKLHLGWRRGKAAGRWVGRYYLGGERYLTATLAEADDLADANGGSVLDFRQAQIKAREWASDLDEKGLFGKSMSEASVRRIVNSVRAAFNAAAKRHSHKLGPSIRDVIRDGLAVPKGSQVDNAREKQILNEADIRRVVDAAKEVDREHGWGGDLYQMVLVLAATGARFSQVARLRVADLQLEQGRLMVPTSRKGSAGGKRSHVAVPIGDDVVDVLKRAVVGRKGHEPLLMRPHWRRAPGGTFGVLEVYARGPWGESRTLTEPWKRVIAKAGLPKEFVPYAFRHSSIVRGLRSGLPTRLTAALHDTSSLMIEKYYAAYISDALGELARRAVVPLVTPEPASIRSVS